MTKIIIELDVDEILGLIPDVEIKSEIANLIKDYHAYSLIKKHLVLVIRDE